MHLYDWPLYFILAGLVLYVVLGGADFGAGFWELAGGRGRAGEEIRDQAHESMAPVWEANHVWLIFVLTVAWTAYPPAFGSIASTLCIPLFIAAVGIIVRGASYAMRSGARSKHEMRIVNGASGVSSILTPFALGAAVGGIASLRVPLGNAAGNLVTSWVNPTSAIVGALAVVTSIYLAAVFLAGDSVRRGRTELVDALRRRALALGVLAGLIAAGGIAVLRFDSHRLFDRLFFSSAIAAVIVSVVAGTVTLALVAVRRFEPARYTSGVAVAGIVAGWALGQKPLVLRDQTLAQSAASSSTLIAIIASVVAGAIILFPSLALLFRLALGGRLGSGPSAEEDEAAPQQVLPRGGRRRLAVRLAAAFLVVGFGLTTIADAAWAHGVGVAALLAFVIAGFAAVRPAEISGPEPAVRGSGAGPGRPSRAR